MIPNMSNIEISNLNASGNDSLTGADSFLTALQPTDTNQIFGGCGYQSWYKPEPEHYSKPEPEYYHKPAPVHYYKPEPKHCYKPEPKHCWKPEPKHCYKPSYC